MTEQAKPGFFEKLKTNVKNGWERLKGFTNRVKSGEFWEETKVEWEITKGVVGIAKDAVTEYWEQNGRNFGERLRNTFSDAKDVIVAGFEVVKNNVKDRMDGLKERCKREGLGSTILGVASEALADLAEMPVQISGMINLARMSNEQLKDEVSRHRQHQLLDSKSEYTQEDVDELSRLEAVRDHVKERGNQFALKAAEAMKRLGQMREARAKLAASRTTTTGTLTGSFVAA